MNTLLLTADRLFDGTNGPTALRPVIRVTGERIESIDRSLLRPAGHC